jgi:hypothetical protein
VASYVGTFTRQAGTGNQAITGVGFTPVAVMLWSSDTLDTSFTDKFQHSLGWSDGTFSTVLTTLSEDNVGTTAVRRAYYEGYVYVSIDNSGTILARASLSSLDADGFTLNFGTNDGVATLINYICMGGSGVTAKSGVFDSATSTGAQAVTGVGFTPTAVLFSGSWSTATSEASAYNSLDLSWMARNSSGTMTGGGVAITAEAGAAVANTTRYQRSNKAICGVNSGISGGVGTVFYDADATSFDADGFTVTWTTAGGVAIGVYYLAIGGLAAVCGALTQPSSTGVQTTAVGSMTPELLLTLSVGDVPRTTPQANARWWFGATDVSRERGVWIGDEDAADPTQSARRLMQTATVIAATPTSTGSSSTTQALATFDSFEPSAFSLDWTTADSTGRETLYLVLGQTYSTGGTVPSGTNPAAGTFPTSIPLLFVTITTQSGAIYPYAETTLADADAWYDGKKEARILRVSPIRRSLSDESGAYRMQSWTLELADTDRVLRGLQASGALVGAVVELYLVDDAVRRAEGAPYRVAAGVVGTHRALSGFRYELTIEDTFGNRLANTLGEKLVPRVATIDADSIPGLQFQYDGTIVPIAYGLLSDESEATPQGVVPAVYVGPTDLSAIGGTGTVDTYLVCGHACANIQSVFFNNPDTPSVRLRVPDASYDDILWCPHKTGWTAKTGQAGQYVDYNGLRYTVLFLEQDIPYTATFTANDGTTSTRSINISEYARNGSVTLTVNLEGIEEDGDGTGAVIDDIARIWQHFLTNFVFTDTEQSGISGWAAIPDLGSGYSMIDTATVTAAKAVADARVSGGYKAGYLIGADGRKGVFDVLRELCFSGDMDMGVNRHGQLILSREDTAAASTVTYTAAADILEDGFETELQSDTFANAINGRYAYRYAAATAPVPSTPMGWAAPSRLIAPYQQWVSGVVTTSDTTSITNVQQRVDVDADLHAIRVSTVASDVLSKKLARARGPSATRDGSRIVTMPTGLQGFHQATVNVDLGTMAAITHPEGLTSSGWTAQTIRIMGITFDPATYAVTHEGRVIV